MSDKSAEKWLWAILMFAFLIRITGVKYGLPLWLYDDEPPFILAALKMIQLKTFLPAAHLADFKTVLYYPPYLSYLYLPFFGIFILGKFFLIFKGPTALFSSYLLTDLSEIFIMARTINILISVASIYLIYKIAKNIFNDARPALIASFLASTSLIHIALSMASRHWMSVFFFGTLVLYFLSNKNLSDKKRYFGSVSSAGIGMGFAIINSVFALLIALWYLLYDKNKLLPLVKEKFYFYLYAIFGTLLILPYILYPGSLGFQADVTTKTAKTFLGAVTSPIYFTKTIALSEPFLVLFAIFGLIFVFKKLRSIFWVFAFFIYLYSIIFYIIFRFEPRFFMGILPVYILLAGYGFFETLLLIKNKAAQKIFMILLLIPFVFALRLSWLSVKNDSRANAVNWVEKNLPAESKILVLARLTRLPSNKAALEEQNFLDPSSLRKADFAEADFVKNPRGVKSFHALNLHDLNNDNFYKNISSYIKQNHYEYILIQPNYRYGENFKNVLEKSQLLSEFGTDETGMSLAESQFLKSPLVLFQINELGPKVAIYKIK